MDQDHVAIQNMAALEVNMQQPSTAPVFPEPKISFDFVNRDFDILSTQYTTSQSPDLEDDSAQHDIHTQTHHELSQKQVDAIELAPSDVAQTAAVDSTCLIRIEVVLPDMDPDICAQYETIESHVIETVMEERVLVSSEIHYLVEYTDGREDWVSRMFLS